MDTGSELGTFLRNRRAMLDPDHLGVVSHGRRRVPGLRREELAQLAGVSATYYTRLEQGQGTGASDGVLAALGRALQLSADERRHLLHLARPPRAATADPPRGEGAAAAVSQLVGAVSEVPVLALDRRNDVLAWNPLAHALLAGHLPFDAPTSASGRPNTLRMLFLDANTRDLHSRWEGEARRGVASLRLTAGEHPDDAGLKELIGELAVRSRPFARLWAEHPVTSCTHGTKHYQHPSVGAMELEFTVATLADGTGHRLMALSAAKDTPSHHALQLLARDVARPDGR